MKRFSWLMFMGFMVCLAGCVTEPAKPPPKRSSPTPSQSEHPTQPEKLKLYIGGMSGATYTVTFENGILAYEADTKLGKAHAELHLPPEKWRELRRMLDGMDVWSWNENYSGPRTASGTFWSVDIIYADRSVHSRGANEYPPHFQEYLNAVRQFLGGAPFQ